MKTSISLLLTVFVMGCASSEKPTSAYSEGNNRPVYHRLALKDLDQMTDLVQEGIRESRKDPAQAMQDLQATLFAVYGRPDDDGMIDKVIAPLRSEIDEVSNWDEAISKLVDGSIAALKNPRGLSPAMQVTHAIVLQNVIVELKPGARRDVADYDLLARIRDSKIELTKEARDERKLRTMKDPPSPSVLAAHALGKPGAAPVDAGQSGSEQGR